MDIPLIRPNPPKLSALVDRLREVEDSGTYSNSGPVSRRFEQAVTQQIFDGRGACLAVANATLGLMIAIKSQTYRMNPARRLAIVPAFTFAATGHAAQWAGLTPLLVDCDPDQWTLCEKAEQRLLAEHRGAIAAIVPYATFGTAIDLERYAWIARRHDVAVVIDAAASLGTLDQSGRSFGIDCKFPVVFSMHATKTFATSEGGLIHCADAARIDTLRAMANFGFESGRSATLPGINAKLAEIPALLAEAKLAEIEEIAARRHALAERYRCRLSNFGFQRALGTRQTPQFMPLLLPASLASHRAAIIAQLGEASIGAGTYFSPHLGEQPWFRESSMIDPLPVTDDISRRMLSLPITDFMTEADVDHVAETLIAICARLPRSVSASPLIRDRVLGTVIIGGGPAGTAVLCAAARIGKLEQMCRDGLVLLDRGEAIGPGMLGRVCNHVRQHRRDFPQCRCGARQRRSRHGRCQPGARGPQGRPRRSLGQGRRVPRKVRCRTRPPGRIAGGQGAARPGGGVGAAGATTAIGASAPAASPAAGRWCWPRTTSSSPRAAISPRRGWRRSRWRARA